MLENIIDNDYMKCDIYNIDNKYYIEIDLPGFKRENLSLVFNNGYLTVEAIKKNNIDITDDSYIKRERTYGSYKREFYIGNVLESDINAKYKDGVLIIEIIKKGNVKDKKTIEIK